MQVGEGEGSDGQTDRQTAGQLLLHQEGGSFSWFLLLLFFFFSSCQDFRGSQWREEARLVSGGVSLQTLSGLCVTVAAS